MRNDEIKLGGISSANKEKLSDNQQRSVRSRTNTLCKLKNIIFAIELISTF